MHCSLVAIVAALCCLVVINADYVVDTQYWDPNYPFQMATCENRNESIMTYQYKQQSTCKDGTDMPWTQVPNPKSRLFFCTDDGQLMYKECAPFQYSGSTSCKVNCSDPIKSDLDLVCWHGTRLQVITCEAKAPTITATSYQLVSPSTTYLYGQQYCEGAYGPTGTNYACNTTHYWSLTACSYGCTNCTQGVAMPIVAPNRCLNSKVLQCYEGYSQNSSDGVVLTTKSADSDTVCARFDYKCHLGDCTCTRNQQMQQTCKRGYGFMTSTDCSTLVSSSAASANAYCCSSNQCNVPVGSAPCSVPPTPSPTPKPTPPVVTIYDEKVSPGFSATYGSYVTVYSSTNPRTGVYSVAFSNPNSGPYIMFQCNGCMNTTIPYKTISLYVWSTAASNELNCYLLQGGTRINMFVTSVPSNTWTPIQFNIPAALYNGVGFSIGGSLFSAGYVYIDNVVMTP